MCCEAREAGSFLAAIARTHQDTGRSLAFLAGGETVVHLTGIGKGGRNQELALAAAEGIAGLRDTAVFSVGIHRVHIHGFFPYLRVKPPQALPHHESQQLVLVPKMFIKSGFAHHGPVTQLVDTDRLKGLFPHGRQQRPAQSQVSFLYPQIQFLFHKPSLYGNLSVHRYDNGLFSENVLLVVIFSLIIMETSPDVKCLEIFTESRFVWWRGTNAFAGWAWKNCEGNRAEVEVYADAACVKLYVNGKGVGRRK